MSTEEAGWRKQASRNTATMRRPASGVLLVGLTLACASIAIHDEATPGADLGSLSVFAWEGGRVESEERIEGARSGLEPMIEEILLEALVARGYRRDADAADFRVSFQLRIEQEVFQTTLRDFDDRPRGRLGGGGSRDVQVEYPYDAGTLTVELRDVGEGALLWRGWAEGAVEPGVTAAERRERIRQLISRILDRLPGS